MSVVACKEVWCINQAISKLEGQIQTLKDFGESESSEFVIKVSEIYIKSSEQANSELGDLIK